MKFQIEDAFDLLTCVNCGCCCELTITNKEEKINDYTIVIPVFTCNVCNFEWTNYLAENIKIIYQSRIIKNEKPNL